VAFAVMLAAVLITVWTGVEYVIEALRLRAKGKLQARDSQGQEQS
jgi:CDP-diacylglycerol--glycerol-3-phosphate 3-phosphatidyltransferase/cardiolipin synthase